VKDANGSIALDGIQVGMGMIVRVRLLFRVAQGIRGVNEGGTCRSNWISLSVIEFSFSRQQVSLREQHNSYPAAALVVTISTSAMAPNNRAQGRILPGYGYNLSDKDSGRWDYVADRYYHLNSSF